MIVVIVPQLLPEKAPAVTLKIGNSAAVLATDYPGNPFLHYWISFVLYL